MGNVVTGNQKRIDTFGSDVVIDANVIRVKAMVITALASAKTVTFIDNDAAVALVLEIPTGTTLYLWPMTFGNGLIFDDSASDLAANDFIFIFTEE